MASPGEGAGISVFAARNLSAGNGNQVSEEKKDNVEYLFRKPGLYKKGPLKFCLHFGTINELMEEAEAQSGLKLIHGKGQRQPDKPDRDDAA